MALLSRENSVIVEDQMAVVQTAVAMAQLASSSKERSAIQAMKNVARNSVNSRVVERFAEQAREYVIQQRRVVV